MLKGIVWNRNILCIKMNLALNSLQWLICHKTKRSHNHIYQPPPIGQDMTQVQFLCGV